MVPLLFQNVPNVYCLVYFFSHWSCPARADIIILDYIVKGQRISKLEENETVSFNFSKNLKNVTREEVSKIITNYTLSTHINVVL